MDNLQFSLFGTKMRLLLVLSLCLATALAVPFKKTALPPYKEFNSKAPRGENRIIDGNLAELGQFPWQVALILTSEEGTFFCGGSLIGHLWIVTAAHCAAGVYEFTALLGDISLVEPAAPSRIIDYGYTVYVHPDYDEETLNNDIALVRLSGYLVYDDYLQPIRLPSPGEVIAEGQTVEVSGFGVTSDDDLYVSDYLYYTELTTITNEECSEVFGELLDSTLCAVGNPYNSTCFGDSGGPLIVRDENGNATLAASVSFVAYEGCSLGYPSGYVRIEPFVDWICSLTDVCPE